jgi:hypothetical protein
MADPSSLGAIARRNPDALEQRRLRFRNIPLRIVLPNLVTLLALCMGLTAIRYGIEGRFETAVTAVMAAAVLDGLDGRLARAIRARRASGRSSTRFRISSISASRPACCCICGRCTRSKASAGSPCSSSPSPAHYGSPASM